MFGSYPKIIEGDSFGITSVELEVKYVVGGADPEGSFVAVVLANS